MNFLSLKEIAEDLGLGVQTLRNYLSSSKKEMWVALKNDVQVKVGHSVFYLKDKYLEWKKIHFKGSNNSVQQKMEE